MGEGGEDKELLYLFTKHSHHQNIIVIYLCQDMFRPGKYAKSISRNAHYFIVFKNPRDQLGIQNLLLQTFPTCWQDTMDVYQKVGERPFGYMVLHPASDDRRRVFSHLLTYEGFPRWHRRKLEDAWCISINVSIDPAHLKRTVLGEGQEEKKKTMGDRSPDIFDTKEEGGRNEEYVEEEEGKEELDPEEKQEE